MTVTNMPPVPIWQMDSCAHAELTKDTLVMDDSVLDQLTNAPMELIFVTMTPHARTPTPDTVVNVMMDSAVMVENVGHH
jgi:hypothetical protein